MYTPLTPDSSAFVLTLLAAKMFSGGAFPEAQKVFPAPEPLARTSINSWDDEKIRVAIEKTDRRKLVFAALWTELWPVMPVIVLAASSD